MKRVLKIDDWFHPDGFPISVERREPQEAFGPHAHEFAELVVVTGGKGLHVCGRDSWELGAGDVFVIAGPRQHAYRDLRDLRLVNILFQPARLKMRLLDLPAVAGYHALFPPESAGRGRQREAGRLHLHARELAQASGLIDRLEGELKARDPGFRFMATAVFMQLMALLARCCGRRPHPDSGALLRIGEALSHLERHLHEDIKLDELAKIARMSRRSFQRAFHSATGAAPRAWIITQRIHRACTMLRHTHLQITEIAYEVGFNDSNYFTRQFRKTTGLTPRAYRLRHANTP